MQSAIARSTLGWGREKQVMLIRLCEKLEGADLLFASEGNSSYPGQAASGRLLPVGTGRSRPEAVIRDYLGNPDQFTSRLDSRTKSQKILFPCIISNLARICGK